MNSGEEMLQLTGTDDSFRSIASWLSDNIVSMQGEDVSSTGRNSCYLSLFFHFQDPPPFKGGGGGWLKTEIFQKGGCPPPTPRNISAKNFWFIMVSPGPG